MHSFYKHAESGLFSIGDQQLESVDSYCPLGHIITYKFDDSYDIFTDEFIILAKLTVSFVSLIKWIFQLK